MTTDDRIPTCDFPAAHSMDTAWFAVDADGHVARFSTGESGAMPSVAGGDRDDVDVLPLRDAPVTYDLAGRRALGGRMHVEGAPPDEDEADRDKLLMFARSFDAVADFAAKVNARRVAASEGVGLIFTDPGEAAITELHKRDACIACFYHWRDDEPVAARGVYDYAHTTDNWIAGPYARVQTPGAPLRGDDLPDDIAAVTVRYAGRFADTPTLQPAELWDCESWEPVWLATDGKTMRAFPGREADLGDAEDMDEASAIEPPIARPAAEVLRPRPASARDDAANADDAE